MSYHTGQLTPPVATPVSGLKGQPVRLWDVFILGPAMVYGGYRLNRRSGDRGIGGFLILAGVLTVAFNGANFWRIQQAGTTEGYPGWPWESIPLQDPRGW